MIYNIRYYVPIVNGDKGTHVRVYSSHRCLDACDLM